MPDFHQTFNGAISTAAEALMDDPLVLPLISSRGRATSAIWDILKRPKSAVKQDNTV